MVDKLWTAYEAAAATGGMLCAKGSLPDRWEAEEWSAKGISIDSRALRPGEIFVALNDVRDGHEFVEDAFAAGAAAALVTKPPQNAPAGKPFLVVRDTLAGLEDLARAARLRNFGKRIAVTGSAGKTSTKDMLRHMLVNVGRVHAADRSFNNHFGVPLTMARMPITARFGIFEIGMNHAGEITPLVDLVRPHAAIITTVASAHLEFFDSEEDIARAKAEIFSGIKPGGCAILPHDNRHFDLLLQIAKTSAAIKAGGKMLTFGSQERADLRLLSTKAIEKGQKVRAQIFGERHDFTLGAGGEHQAMNALAAIGAAVSVGAPLSPCLQSLATFHAGAGRGEQIKIPFPTKGDKLSDRTDGTHFTLIDESYNANPASMRASLSLLASLKPGAPTGRRIAVLGEMLELGIESAPLHAALIEPLMAANIEKLYVAGAGMDALWRVVPEAIRGLNVVDPAELAKKIAIDLHEGDIIMVKGSNGSKVSLVANALKDLQSL